MLKTLYQNKGYNLKDDSSGRTFLRTVKEILLIKSELRIDKYKIGSTKRKRTSAPDNRNSSKQIGIVGIVFLTIVIGLVILIDLTAVGTGFRIKRNKVKGQRLK